MSSDVKQRIIDRVTGKKADPAKLTFNDLAGFLIEVPEAVADRLRVPQFDSDFTTFTYDSAQVEEDFKQMKFESDVEHELNANLDTVLGADVRTLHNIPVYDDIMSPNWEPVLVYEHSGIMPSYVSMKEVQPVSHTPLPQDEAKAGAKKYLAETEPEVLHLDEQSGIQFVEALLNPPEPNDALKEAAQLYKEWMTVKPLSEEMLKRTDPSPVSVEHLYSERPDVETWLRSAPKDVVATPIAHTVQPVWASLPPEQVEMLEAFEHNVSTKLLRRLKELESRVELLVSGKEN